MTNVFFEDKSRILGNTVNYFILDEVESIEGKDSDCQKCGGDLRVDGHCESCETYYEAYDYLKIRKTTKKNSNL